MTAYFIGIVVLYAILVYFHDSFISPAKQIETSPFGYFISRYFGNLFKAFIFVTIIAIFVKAVAEKQAG